MARRSHSSPNKTASAPPKAAAAPPASTTPEATPDGSKWWARLWAEDRPFFVEILPTLIGLRVAIYVMTFVFFRMTQGGPPGPVDVFAALWNRWDCEHYLYLATHGYVTEPTHAKTLAFFPVYPMLVGLLSLPGRVVPWFSPLAVGMFVSNAASFGGFYYLYRYTKKRFDPESARRAVYYAGLFCTAYFYQAAYTEGLFFFLTVASFYYFENDRPLLGAVFGAFSAGTRLTGIILAGAGPLAFRERRKKFGRSLWAAAIVPLGLVVYLGINYKLWGDPLRFIEFQRTAWGHESATPWGGLDVTLSYFNNPARGMRDFWFRDVMELLACAIGIAASVVSLRVGLGAALFVFGSWLAWTSNTWWMSGLRFCLVLFPLFVYLGSRKWPAGVHHVLWIISACVLMTFALSFTSGSWTF